MFLNTLNNDTFLEKKFLNMIYYNKSYIRSELLNTKQLKILDNNQLLNIIPVNKKSPYILTNSQNLEGLSLASKEICLKNNLNSSLNFKMNSVIFSNNKIDHLNPLIKILPILIKTKNLKIKRFFKRVVVLNPVKGGFLCYCSGFFGFIPVKHVIYSIKKLSAKIKKKANEKKKNNKVVYLIQMLVFNFIFVLPLKFFIGSTSLYINYKKNNFSNVKKKKNKTYFNSLSIVFLAFKKKKKKNLYAKIKKKN